MLVAINGPNNPTRRTSSNGEEGCYESTYYGNRLARRQGMLKSANVVQNGHIIGHEIDGDGTKALLSSMIKGIRIHDAGWTRSLSRHAERTLWTLAQTLPTFTEPSYSI